MGHQNIIDRECLANPGKANLYGCRWCGRYPRRVYFYAGHPDDFYIQPKETA